MTRARQTMVQGLLLLALGLSGATTSYAGLLTGLAKLGKAGKAASAGKAGATAGAAGAGVAVTHEAGTAAAKTGAMTVDELSAASGLGKAVPDHMSSLLRTPGKKLSDIPDLKARQWLETPPKAQTPLDADLMVRDYARLLQGQPALGKNQVIPSPKPVDLRQKEGVQVPWFAIELLARAALQGHRQAQREQERLCQQTPPPEGLQAQCQKERAARTSSPRAPTTKETP